MTFSIVVSTTYLPLSKIMFVLQVGDAPAIFSTLFAIVENQNEFVLTHIYIYIGCLCN